MVGNCRRSHGSLEVVGVVEGSFPEVVDEGKDADHVSLKVAQRVRIIFLVAGLQTSHAGESKA